MIPAAEQLAPWYDQDLVAVLGDIREHCSKISDPVMRNAVGREAIATIWPTQAERIQNTHWIEVKPSKDRGINQKPGTKLFRWNFAQKRLYNDVILPAREEHRPCRFLVLKARQLGISTFMQSLDYDELEQAPNVKAQTISYDVDSTVEMFEKARYIHQNLWFPRPLSHDRNGAIKFKAPHFSSFFTTTARNVHAGRSYTFAHLHMSEVPMWEHPDDTANSLLQTVPDAAGTTIAMEFTARGAQGYAYETWCDAVDGKNDFVPFFAPWFWDPEYSTAFENDEARSTFALRQSKADEAFQQNYKLTLEQMNWWAWCLRNKCGGSENKRKQEYPSNAEEAFLMSGSPVFERVDELDRLQRACKPPLRRGHILLTSSLS